MNTRMHTNLNTTGKQTPTGMYGNLWATLAQEVRRGGVPRRSNGEKKQARTGQEEIIH